MEFENADRELDDFLAVIAGRAAEGITLAELAEELHLGLARVNPAEEEICNAIQLLTSHKAKGLEWQAVILPCVFRAIESKSPPYPRVVSGESGREIVCRDKADFANHARHFVTERERQQLQRLLYVMSTRAKRTLVLVDDEALFAGQARRGGWSAGELLGFSGGKNRDAWRALPETFSLPEEFPPVESAPRSEVVSLPDLSQEDVRHAVEKAGQFPRRITPHALAVHAHDEAEPEQQAEQEDEQPVDATSPGILYGTWWHEFMQTIPWQQSTTAWQRKFVEAQARSPQPERAAREWELFRRSALAQWLEEPGRLVQAEIPFLCRKTGEETCLEGVIDLAVYTESESAWRVIDWKTNRIGPAGSDGLVEIYRGQIRAYVRVLREMLSAEVRGSLYLTQTGEWLPVE
jgi:ATP-dependent exoDNAse (exonuclease V) beta subunit